MRKTKIVCTIGPATDDDSVMRQVMLSGMNVARFNFSHGDHATHEKRFEQISRLREELGLPIATLMDTRGPEIRLGKFVDDKPVTIETGDTYTLTTDDVLCDDKVGSISFKNLPRDVKPGVHILVNDGVIEMVVEKVTVTTIVCHVIHGGVLSNNKGINVPGVQLSMPYLSESDKNDLEFAAKMPASCGLLRILTICGSIPRVWAGSMSASLPKSKMWKAFGISTRFWKPLTASWLRVATWA